MPAPVTTLQLLEISRGFREENRIRREILHKDLVILQKQVNDVLKAAERGKTRKKIFNPPLTQQQLNSISSYRS